MIIPRHPTRLTDGPQFRIHTRPVGPMPRKAPTLCPNCHAVLDKWAHGVICITGCRKYSYGSLPTWGLRDEMRRRAMEADPTNKKDSWRYYGW